MVLDMLSREILSSIKKSGKALSSIKNEKQKSIVDMLINATIIGGLALFAVSPLAIPCVEDLWVMARAFGAAFIFQFAIERGLKKGGEKFNE